MSKEEYDITTFLLAYTQPILDPLVFLQVIQYKYLFFQKKKLVDFSLERINFNNLKLNVSRTMQMENSGNGKEEILFYDLK